MWVVANKMIYHLLEKLQQNVFEQISRHSNFRLHFSTLLSYMLLCHATMLQTNSFLVVALVLKCTLSILLHCHYLHTLK